MRIANSPRFAAPSPSWGLTGWRQLPFIFCSTSPTQAKDAQHRLPRPYVSLTTARNARTDELCLGTDTDRHHRCRVAWLCLRVDLGLQQLHGLASVSCQSGKAPSALVSGMALSALASGMALSALASGMALSAFASIALPHSHGPSSTVPACPRGAVGVVMGVVRPCGTGWLRACGGGDSWRGRGSRRGADFFFQSLPSLKRWNESWNPWKSRKNRPMRCQL
jgi:hypothetical protein